MEKVGPGAWVEKKYGIISGATVKSGKISSITEAFVYQEMAVCSRLTSRTQAQKHRTGATAKSGTHAAGEGCVGRSPSSGFLRVTACARGFARAVAYTTGGVAGLY